MHFVSFVNCFSHHLDGVLCDGAGIKISAPLLVPISSTQFNQHSLIKTHCCAPDAAAKQDLRGTPELTQIQVGLDAYVSALENGPQKAGETLEPLRAIPEPWSLPGSEAD